MFKVDNSGKGNCLFYGYSISLMYYLRSKNDPKLAQGIFEKLKLNKEAQLKLEVLLSKTPNIPFSKEDITKVIEPILGRAVRDLAADQVQVEFNKSPHSTSLFTSAKYGLEFGFKHAFQSYGSEYSELIDHEFDNEDYKQADIYHSDELKLEMELFVTLRAPVVIEEMQRRWAAQEKSLKESDSKLELTNDDMKGLQSLLLSEIMGEETVEFFRSDRNANLNRFLNHIKKEFEWGSEETLMTLHRAIQGERMERNQGGTIDTFYDFPIHLHVFTNGVSPFPQKGTPDMILNNISNYHWTSIIPDHVFTSKADDPEFQLLELLDDQIPPVRLGKLDNQEPSNDRNLMQEWVYAFKKNMEAIKLAPNAVSKEKEVQSMMIHFSKGILHFASNPELRVSLSLVFNGFMAWIPKAMAENKKPLGLSQLGLYSQSDLFKQSSQYQPSSEKESKESKEFKEFKEPKESPVIKNYPPELNRFVKKNRQTGPKVAAALKQMFELGEEGNGQYTPEKCKNIAERYLAFVQAYHKNSAVDGVKQFIQQMDRVMSGAKASAHTTLSL